jgi:hypothetical protein
MMFPSESISSTGCGSSTNFRSAKRSSCAKNDVGKFAFELSGLIVVYPTLPIKDTKHPASICGWLTLAPARCPGASLGHPHSRTAMLVLRYFYTSVGNPILPPPHPSATPARALNAPFIQARRSCECAKTKSRWLSTTQLRYKSLKRLQAHNSWKTKPRCPTTSTFVLRSIPCISKESKRARTPDTRRGISIDDIAAAE